MSSSETEFPLSLFVSNPLSWYPKSDRYSMEHPFFSLRKNKVTSPFYYESPNGNVKITIVPSGYGMPTIWDKDLLIYATTLIRESMNRGDLGPINRPIKINIWNYLEATAKGDGSAQYKGVLNTLRRLKGCVIETNIETNGIRQIMGFSLVDVYDAMVRTKTGYVASVSIKVCDWLYRAIWNATKEMLSMNPDYFRLDGGIERRLYELARKHCGNQPYWKVSIPLLWKKSGCQCELKKFRYKVLKSQVGLGTLPDYRVILHPENDQLIFYSKHFKAPVEAIINATFEKENKYQSVYREPNGL